jgi:hypothetical protein
LSQEIVPQETVGWSANVTLVSGRNVITAQSRSVQFDDTEITTFPVTHTYFYVATPSSPLVRSAVTLLTSPPNHGKITGLADAASLEICKVYTIKAVPTGNWVFSNWTSGTNANNLSPILPKNATLAFLMSSNLILQANFVTNPFSAVAGVYNGLFSPTNGVTEDSSGFFTATIPASSRGVYSAKLLLDGGSCSFSGMFDLSGNAEHTVVRSGKAFLTVELHINLATPDDKMTGNVINSTSTGRTSALLGDRAVFNKKSNPATNYAGCYTMILPPDSDSANESGGYGYATLHNNLAGQVTIAGHLGDGTAISQTVPVSKDGYIPLYASLYSGRGSILGWLTLTNNPSQTIIGTDLSWIKPSSRTGKLYEAGFTNTNITLLGSSYVPPNPGADILALTNGTLTISNGNLAAALTYSNLTITGNDLVNNEPGNPTNQLKGTINPRTGVITITFRPTDAKSDSVAKGAILQISTQTNAAGWFLNSGQSGCFLLQQ